MLTGSAPTAEAAGEPQAAPDRGLGQRLHGAFGAESIPLAAEAFARLMRPFGRITRLLVAVSGGPDSVALMGLAAAWGAANGTSVAAATVDHRLRRESRGEADAVMRAAAALGLPHATLDRQGPAPSTRIQEAAREARYALLVAHAGSIGATHLATAHTLDDQAETILYRLARGSGPAGLVGMQASVRRGGIIHLRPLLGVRKAALVATCEANGWPWFDDPSNRDPRYARTRWRHLSAQLEAAGLAPERFGVLSHRLARGEAAIAAAVETAYPGLVRCRADGRLGLDAAAFAAQAEEVRLRALARALAETAGCSAAPIRLQRLERLCADLCAAIAAGVQMKRSLGGAIVWARSDGTVQVSREPARRSASTRRERGAVAGAPAPEH